MVKINSQTTGDLEDSGIAVKLSEDDAPHARVGNRLEARPARGGRYIQVSTVDGHASVKIPPGTGSGRKLRLRGKGVIADGVGPGDHYVTVQLDVPAELDDKGKKLLHELTAHLAQTGGRRKG